MDLQARIKTLPLTSGVYLFLDEEGRVLYVGKAVSLRRRVASYFRGRIADPRIRRLAAEVRSIDIRPTESEAEALLLEAGLIKKHRPRFNIDLRDDKSYPCISITDEPFPRVAVVRPRRREEGAGYYGPYVNPRRIREALGIIRKIFPFRTCDPLPAKACLDHHLGLCGAPCIGATGPREYRRNIRRVRAILEGRKDDLYRDLRRQMERLSRARRFEEAAVVRDQLRAVGALYSGSGKLSAYKEVEQLQRSLGLPRPPERIEAIDISNTMGEKAVGALVSFFNGRPEKSRYRRFRIREVSGIDDFRMIAEVVRRRFRRIKAEGGGFPDLLVIDGGKGQLAAACRVLRELDVHVPILSLAKREEEVFLPRRKDPVILPRESLALRLLQRVRDEAHRFAVGYHRRLRRRGLRGD